MHAARDLEREPAMTPVEWTVLGVLTAPLIVTVLALIGFALREVIDAQPRGRRACFDSKADGGRRPPRVSTFNVQRPHVNWMLIAYVLDGRVHHLTARPAQGRISSPVE